MEDQQRHQLKIAYEIEYEEAHEIVELLSIGISRQRRRKQFLIILISVILIFMFVITHFQAAYLVIAIAALAINFVLSRSQKKDIDRHAKTMFEQKNQYIVSIHDDGHFILGKNKRVDFIGDKNARAAEGPLVFVARVDRTINICLPKRKMDEQQQEFVRKVLKEHYATYDEKK